VSLRSAILTLSLILPALPLTGGAPPPSGFRVQQILPIPATPGQTVNRMAVDSHGNVVAAANTPTSTVVHKIDPDGHVLFSRTLPGGLNLPVQLALDSQDNIYVALDVHGVILAKLRARDGTVEWQEVLSGLLPGALAVESTSGDVFLALLAFRGQLDTTPGAYSSTFGGGALSTLMYLLRISADGSRIIFAASYGGSATNCYGGSGCVTRTPGTGGSAILFDRDRNVWVAGNTNTTDLPLTPDALKKTCGCSHFSGDAFLAKFSNDGSRLLYATYIGTTPSGVLDYLGNDTVGSAAMDPAGHIWVAGTTNGADLPVTSNALQKEWGGGNDGFVFEYDPAANGAPYVSYFGGGGTDSVTDIASRDDGAVVFSGHAESLPLAPVGFTRGSDFIAMLDPTRATTLVNGSTGAGLGVTPDGLIAAAGASNAAVVIQPDGSDAPSVFATTSSAGTALAGQVAPGELITLYGTSLDGADVRVDGAPVPVLYSQADQLNAVLPFDIAGNAGITLAVNGVTSALLGVVDAQPDAFRYGPRLLAAALNQDQTINSTDNPAARGTIVSVWATGFGVLSPKPSIEVLYNDQPLEILYAGQAPALVDGVVQVNFRLPPAASGETQFQFRVAGWESSPFTIVIEE
jgi:uncharacterized protein (TIGR03437 family)